MVHVAASATMAGSYLSSLTVWDLSNAAQLKIAVVYI